MYSVYSSNDTGDECYDEGINMEAIIERVKSFGKSAKDMKLYVKTDLDWIYILIREYKIEQIWNILTDLGVK